MLRKCKTCGIEKELFKFVKSEGNNYRHKCKECKNSKRRTGLTNTGRFKKGNIPWNLSESKHSKKYKNWTKLVKERDGWICQNCGSKKTERKNLHAHHIIQWKKDPLKRFDLNNGITLCAKCHNLIEYRCPAGWNKGIPCSEDKKKKISEGLKGNKNRKRKINANTS